MAPSFPTRRTVLVHAIALAAIVLVLVSITTRPDPTPEFSTAPEIAAQVAVAIVAGLVYAASVEFARWKFDEPIVDPE